MAGNIKGITIQIGADTKAFRSGLSELNKSTKGLQTELKSVDKALKFNPNSTELLTQKQELLQKSVEDTKNKVDALKTAKDKADAEMKNGTEINQEQYRQLQREIVIAEGNLRGFEQQAKEASATYGLLGEKSEKFNGIVQGASLAAAGGAIAVGTAAVKITADFDSAMSQVSAVSGATGDELETLRDKAKQMGESTKFSATESAEAFNYMAMAGWKSEQMIGGIEGIMNLAAASGEDLALTSDIVTDALTAFGMQAEESSHFADVLASVSSNANTNVSLLGETFKYVAPVAGAMGYSVEDCSVAIGLMANSGIKGSMAGTSLKNTLVNLAKPTDAIANAMDVYNISLTDANGEMLPMSELIEVLRDRFDGLSESQQSELAATLAGKEGMAGLLAIVNASEADYNKLTGAIDDCDGVAQSMADTMNDNLSGQLTLLKSQLEGVAIEIGEALVPKIRELVEHFSSFISWIMDNKDQVVSGLAAVAAGLLALNVVIMLQKLIQGFKAFKLAQEGATLSQYALNLAMSLNPIGLLVAAIVGLIAYVVTLYNTNEDFRNKVNAAWESVKNVVMGAITAISTFISDLVNTIKDFATTFYNAGKSIFTSLWDGLKNVWESISKWVSDKVSWLTDKLTFWKKSKDEMGGDDSGSDGSHRTGLREVPYDGYKAILHKGEEILTQPEADRYRAGESSSTRTDNFIVNIDKIENSNGRSASDFLKEMEFYRKSRALAIGGV